jgi:hypothetical protein
MIDPHTALLEYLEAQPEMRDVAIFAGVDVPPPGYKPGEDGDGIAFRARGGNEDYAGALLTPSLQFKCYSTDAVDAYSLYTTLDGVLHGARSGAIAHGERETIGQPLTEPDTGWRFVLGYYTVLIRQTHRVRSYGVGMRE